MNATELFYILLEEKIDNSEYLVKEFVNYEELEYKLAFFDDVADEDKKEILIEFIHLVINYQSESNNRFFNSSIKKNKEEKILAKTKFRGKIPYQKKPHEKINDTIKIIEEYQSMIHRLYGSQSKIDGTYLLFNPPKEIKENYFNNIKILDDLKNKNFKIISKGSCGYQLYHPSKNKIFTFLKDTRLKYNLNANDEKQLRDSIK